MFCVLYQTLCINVVYHWLNKLLSL